MKNPFKGPPKQKIVESGSRKNGWFHMFWERQPMPDPGAMNYSYESLALSPFAPSGPSVATRQPFQPILPSPMPYYQKQVVLNGIPTNSGNVVLAPLLNPNVPGGYNGALEPIGVLPFNKNNPPPVGEII